MGKKHRPPCGTLEYEIWLQDRLIKRKQRKALRVIPNIKLSQEEARKRTSPTALSKELGLPVETLKALLPKRKIKVIRKINRWGKSYRAGEYVPKRAIMPMGLAVKLLNESKLNLTDYLNK